MYTLPDICLASLADKLPSTESLLRLQQELEKIAKCVETKEESQKLAGLTGQQVDRIISEIVSILTSPSGFELTITILPALIEVSKQGSRAQHHLNHN